MEIYKISWCKKSSFLGWSLQLHKECLSLHKEYVGLLPQEVVDEEDDWFETVDEVVYSETQNIKFNIQ